MDPTQIKARADRIMCEKFRIPSCSVKKLLAHYTVNKCICLRTLHERNILALAFSGMLNA